MTEDKPKGDRIAKVMARAGIASRRDAERMILAGRVAVNGEKVESPALDVTPADKVTLDGKPIDAPQPARLWLYYKPVGLVTSAKDEKGRQTVFDTMPEGMPRVMSVGRLDLTSEGLLLLTNDGALKRRLELPSTGWLRKYRVRVNGRPNDATFDPLRRGATIEGEDFLPMDITLDKQQGANAWLTVGLREGKNREIRRAMSEVGLTVNRLIRVSYGPFRLNQMKPGDVVEVRARVLREQLGSLLGGEKEEKATRKPRRPRTSSEAHAKGRRGNAPASGGGRGKTGARPTQAGTADRPPRQDRKGVRPDRVGKPNDKGGASADERAPRASDRPERAASAQSAASHARPGADAPRTAKKHRKEAGAGGKEPAGRADRGRSGAAGRAKGSGRPGGAPRPEGGNRPRSGGPRKGGPSRKR
ncbi:Ribosomal large subunit pseudouridine synthase B [Defluviimonas aquaemixtae]|uniref:Pseudouridine synthase n=1 Tax=Albidovulum aquaemixtae TaxID=1542388 RepID=A0A2R8B447_9RHOB|nr:pseudouridine synthase [Defluviimonas aquaemixtae]SPH17300.1 Ribosomal large subunit pseudouridine synthase B [Defluviimonas aquaemixtae]